MDSEGQEGVGTFGGLGVVAACFVASGLSAAAGVGGGGIYVPAMMMLKGWSVNVAIPVSHVMISTSAVAMLGANLVFPSRGGGDATSPEETPREDAPCVEHRPHQGVGTSGASSSSSSASSAAPINVDALLVFVSISLSTTVFGVLLNMTLPRWVTGSLLLAFLCRMAAKTVAKARAGEGGRTGLLAGDKGMGRGRRRGQVGGEAGSLPGSPLQGAAVLVSQESSLLVAAEEGMHKRHIGGDSPEREGSGEEEDDSMHSSLLRVNMEAASLPPLDAARGGSLSVSRMMGWAPWKVATLLTLWLFLVVCAGLRKDSIGGRMLGIDRCGLIWWMLVAAPVAVGGSSGYVLLHTFTEDYTAAVQQGVRFPDGEIVFSPGLTRHYVWYAAFTGVASGLLGIGGATVLAPLLLQMGADPRRSAPVTATFVLFTSSATALQYAFAGRVDDPLVPLLGVIAFLGSLAGLVFVRWRRSGGQASARIVQALALLMTLSALLAGWVVMQELMFGIEKGFSGLQQSVCTEEPPIVLIHP